jgi:hypothetical protein
MALIVLCQIPVQVTTMTQNDDVQALQAKAEKRLAALKKEKLVTRISVLSTFVDRERPPNDSCSACRSKRIKRLLISIGGRAIKQKAGSCKRWVILSVTCLSKWIAENMTLSLSCDLHAIQRKKSEVRAVGVLMRSLGSWTVR